MFNNVAVNYPLFSAILQWMTVVYLLLTAMYFYIAACRGKLSSYCADLDENGLVMTDSEDDDDEEEDELLWSEERDELFGGGEFVDDGNVNGRGK